MTHTDPYRMITVDELGRSILDEPAGAYGRHLQQGALCHVDGAPVEIVEIFTHIHTARGLGGSNYIYVEVRELGSAPCAKSSHG